MAGSMMNNMGMDMDMSGPPDYSNLTAAELVFVNRPWFSRTLPGRTGTFSGHFVPAAFFFGFATAILLVALHRARNVPAGKTFAELHIPENNPLVLKRMCTVIMVATTIGFVAETMGGILDAHNAFHQLAHQTLYFSYFIVGLCGLLECKGRLPPDTHRGAMAIALITSYLMWHSHGTMKKLAADQVLHILLSYINLSNAAVVAYSMRFTDSVIAYVAGFGLLILQALWLITAGLYECCFDLPMHEIATYLAVQCLLVFLAIVLIAAYFGPEPSQQDNLNVRREFCPLKCALDEDEESWRGMEMGDKS